MRRATLAWPCIVALLVADVPPTDAAAIKAVSPAESLVAGLVRGLVHLIAFGFLARKRLKSARQKLRQANELADREYERNLAQAGTHPPA